MMLHVRRLTALTELRLTGANNLAGDVPVAMLTSCMPPDLAVLQMATAYVSWPLPTVPIYRSHVDGAVFCSI
jgi:hypothetical protein